MPYTIARDVCEGIGDCLAVCPTECIDWATGATNAKGTNHTLIDPARCIDCGACLSVCPIEDAIVDAWRPELQGSPPGLPCIRCRVTVETGRRFCQACGAPVVSLCTYDDVRLLDGPALARLWADLEKHDPPRMLELAAVIRRADPRSLGTLPSGKVQAVMRECVRQTSPAGTIVPPERNVAFHLRYLVARGEITYTEGRVSTVPS
jgi:NAD-dependent dihydropyrimidine dehydrogenase PreA subunit